MCKNRDRFLTNAQLMLLYLKCQQLPSSQSLAVRNNRLVINGFVFT